MSLEVKSVFSGPCLPEDKAQNLARQMPWTRMTTSGNALLLRLVELIKNNSTAQRGII
jgi:hypothetical protein